MNSELFVSAREKDIEIALLEDGRLAEVQQDTREERFAVGNIYLGRVKKVMPALNAAFVDVGSEKEAFLHFLDLGIGFRKINAYVQGVRTEKRRPSMARFKDLQDVGKEGKIADFLKPDDMILVQVEKEPINTKGPRLTAEVSLAGRNIVLIPFETKVMVSNKIKQESERQRLRQLVQSIRPDGFGVIVRTQAEGKKAGELDAELKLLLRRWEETVKKLQQQRGPQVALISEEIGRTIGVVRDIFNPTFQSIWVDDEALYKDILAYVEFIAPESKNIVHLYKGETPIFDNFQVTRQMKTGLGRTVGFKNGGYLIIEKTEALFSIDVNSGSKRQGDNQEDNAFNTNMLAAEEIAHCLRLRDIGGIIIVDFIDMDDAEHRQALYEKICELMKADRAKHNVLPLSKFGLMQITRQRVRPALEIDMTEACPTCGGKGKIQGSMAILEQIEEAIQAYVKQFGKKLVLHLHPFVYAYVDKGWLWSTARKWKRQYGLSKVMANERVGIMEYHFYSAEGMRLEMREEKAEIKPILPKVVEQPKVQVIKPVEQPKPQVKQEVKPAEVKKQEVKPVEHKVDAVTLESELTTKEEKAKVEQKPEMVKSPEASKNTEDSKTPKKSKQPKEEQPVEQKVEEQKPKTSKKKKQSKAEKPIEQKVVEEKPAEEKQRERETPKKQKTSKKAKVENPEKPVEEKPVEANVLTEDVKPAPKKRKVRQKRALKSNPETAKAKETTVSATENVVVG